MTLDPRFELLAHVVEIANTSVDVNERLDSILGAVNTHLGARSSVLFMQEQNLGVFARANYWPKDQALPQFSLEARSGRMGEVARRRQPLFLQVSRPSGDPALDQFCLDQESVALLPVMDDNRLYAVLLLAMEPGRALDDDEVRLLQMVSREMAGSIRNFRLYFEAKKRIAELSVISDLGRAAVSTIEVEHLLDTVVGICVKLLGAKGGQVMVSSSLAGEEPLVAYHGQVPEYCRQDQACLRGCAPLKLGGLKQGKGVCELSPVRQEFESGLCAPLTFKGRFEGHLCVFDKVLRQEGSLPGFTHDDRNLLSTMASMVAPALENALTFQQVEELAQRNEEMVGALATLFEISTVLMTTVDINQTVLIILEAVVHPAGLDHDRVILFLADEAGQNLRPVAELDRERAAAPAQELTQALLALRARGNGLPQVADEELARLSTPLQSDGGVLYRTLAEKRPVLVSNPGGEPGLAPALLAALGPHPFATVPMFAKGKAVGVLLASNLQSGRPFLERDLKLLGMLANLGGLAVEGSRLYHSLDSANRELAHMRNRLLEADKLAALGEVAAGVAHEIRNPLVSIGGFTRRIRKKVGEDSPIRPYLDVIIEEVTRLEKTLNEMLDFSTDARHHYDEHSLNTIMEQALDLLQRELVEGRFKVVKQYAPDLPSAYCDERQIKHVFLNIYLNALQAMGPEGGVLTLRTFAVVREGKQFVAGEVRDTGGGIPMEVIHNIFNPFFTTKDSGSGLGLSIVHKIVTRHFGQVEVHNHSGEGASFLVTLPAAEEARAYLK